MPAGQQVEAADLPDLDEARRRPRHEPKAVPPVPSTRRRCPPRNPRCNEAPDAAADATPTPSPNWPPRGNPHPGSARADVAPGGSIAPAGGGAHDLASATPASYLTLLSAAAGGGRTFFDLSLLDFISGGGGYAISDSPARTLPAPDSGAAQGLPSGGYAYSPTAPAAGVLLETNLALGKPATQSSDAAGGVASRAVDGNTDGSWYADSVTHTASQSQAWWQVDLGSVMQIKDVRLWNRTDCCAWRLSNFYVLVSDQPFASTDLGAAINQAGVSNYYTAGQAGSPTAVAVNRSGRYVRVQLAGADYLSLAEVEVLEGPPPPPANLALGKPATQSSDAAGGVASRAVDGNADGNWYVNSVTHTGNDLNSWWQVDLGGVRSIGEVKLWNRTDCCSERLSNFYVFVSDVPFSSAGLTATQGQPGVSGFYTPGQAGQSLSVAVNRTGRYVRVQLAGNWQNLSLAEVQVFGRPDVNLATGKPAAQSSNPLGAGPERAVDGNADGNYYADSVTHTGGDLNSWWQVDLGSVQQVNTVKLWNRTDCCLDRLSNFYVLVSDAPFASTDLTATLSQAGVSSFYNAGAVAESVVVAVGRTGRYVRVQLAANSQYLSLAEVQVWGESLAAGPGTGTGLTGEYYNGDAFQTYVLTRADAAVNFDWGSGSPAASVGADFFSARWTGTVVPRYSEEYTFYTTSDDGVRLWIDGQLIIDKWFDQAAATEWWDKKVTLEAGRAYAIRMEFYEHWGGAAAQLRWASASQAKEVVPQSCLYGCWKGADQFARDFFQGGLGRQPSAGELQDWAGRLNQAQGDSQLLAEAQGLGAQVFASAEYAGRGRTDSEYVSDLYRAYLQREPDAGGLSWWTSQIVPCGSDQACRRIKWAEVRSAFDQSGEFTEKVRSLCGTAAAAPANGGSGYNFSTARLDPVNRTGGAGVDPYSRNYNFSIPLVGLAGRAGLDLGLTLSYNSLVWTKDAGGVTFDADQGFPSPGFRLGFPAIEPKFVNPLLQQAGQPARYSYLLLTPSGARVELRQVGTSNVYESADSSYLQLTESDMTLRSADGTQLSFIPLGGSYRCDRVKDRNGNFLSVSYYGDGRMDKVTDTLGRVVVFEYDGYLNLKRIWQTWKRELENGTASEGEHEWATFGFGDALTLQPSFSNLAVIGEQSGAQIPVLRQVGLDDGSFYRFKYNQWGQVWKVTRYAADSLGANGQPDESHPLSSTRIDLPGSDLTAASAQSDCPRFREGRVWVEQGVMGQSGEVTTKYDEWAPNMASCEVLAPDGKVKSVETYAASGWQRGMTTQSVAWAINPTTGAWETKRTTAVTLEHDGGDAAYPTNPRVTQTTVSDPQGNARTTHITYTAPDDFQGAESGYYDTLNVRLPKKAEECADSNCSTVLRTTVTDYKVPNLGQYVSRRILGLARYGLLYEGAESPTSLRSKVGYVYDDTGYVDGVTSQPKFLQPLQSPAWQHYKDDYGTALQWRGNVTRIRRYEVSQQNGAESGGFTETLAGYNVAGAGVFTRDAEKHWTTVSYEDAFYANVNRTHTDPTLRLQTYAYPTAVTDPDGFTSWTWYDYDMGVATKARSQKPNTTANGTDGPVWTTFYDGAGRAVKTTNSVNAAHTEQVYDPSMTLVKTFTTVSDESTQNLNLRFYSAAALDGAGRVRGTARDFTGSTTATPAGNYSAQIIHYDAAGRAVFQSYPTEMRIANGTWTPAGDDANGGLWQGTAQEYDWKGRPTKTINADGSDRIIEYGGCGCAGGEVVTTRGELVPTFEPPPAPAQGRRAQRVYYDELGRAKKAEVLNWDGSVYSTATNVLDALDRVTSARRYQGTDQSGVYQESVTTYDGYGRLKSSHAPEQDAGRSTTYSYNDDDTLASATDARGVKAVYGYNNRHLVTSVAYDLSGVIAGQNVAGTPGVTFAYDAAGNRTSMDDGPGRVDYTYDELSRLKTEARQFDGLSGARTLAYDYTPAGALKSLTEQGVQTINYQHDAAGRLTLVTGTPYAGNVGTYASDFQYRAWGALKSFAYGHGPRQTRGYDSRMRLSSFEVAGPTPQGPPVLLKAAYQYHADGRVKYLDEMLDADDRFDRSYDYDQAGRLRQSLTAAGARVFAGLPAGSGAVGPYEQTYSYDVWGNLTGRSGKHWSQPQSFTATYTNDRRQGWTYDAAGNVVADDSAYSRGSTFDAAGRKVEAREHQRSGGAQTTLIVNDLTLAQGYDGDGRVARREERSVQSVNNGAPQTSVETTYYVRSGVLGGAAVAELDGQGQRQKGYVYAGGARVAKQWGGLLSWQYEEPVGGGTREGSTQGYFYAGATELDPLGADVGAADPYAEDTSVGYVGSYETAGNGFDQSGGGCEWNGMPVKCEVALAGARTQQLVGVGVRSQGQEGGGFGLGLNLRVWRFNVYQYRPSGEDPGAWVDPEFGEVEGINSNKLYQVGYFYAWHLSLGAAGMAAGGRPQGPVPQPHPTPTPKPNRSSCSKFVDMLVTLAAANKSLMSPNQFGRILGGFALKDDRLAKYNHSKDAPVDGFKGYLVGGGQRGDVFKHILAHAGATLIGNSPLLLPGDETGYQRSEREYQQDVDQFFHPEQSHPGEPPTHTADEAYAEMMDDISGRNVGNSLLFYFRGDSGRQKLRSDIFIELCDH